MRVLGWRLTKAYYRCPVSDAIEHALENLWHFHSTKPRASAIGIIVERMASNSMPDLPTVQGLCDSFWIDIARRLSEALPFAFAGVDYRNKGEDFPVAVPRYKLPGKLDEIAAKVLEKVRTIMVGSANS